MNIEKSCSGGQLSKFLCERSIFLLNLIYLQNFYNLQFLSKPPLVGTQMKALSVQTPKMILLMLAVCFVFKISYFL